MKGNYQLRTPKAMFSAQRRCISPRGTEGRDKRQTQEIEDEVEREGNKGKEAGIFAPEGQRAVSG